LKKKNSPGIEKTNLGQRVPPGSLSTPVSGRKSLKEIVNRGLQLPVQTKAEGKFITLHHIGREDLL
jgi:hypothetical protein